MRLLVRLAPLALVIGLAASPAFAQGNGKGLAKGRGAKPPASQPATAPGTDGAAGSPTGQPLVPGTGVRHFGVWLDDASILPKGKGWTTFGFGFWRSMYGHQWDLPTMDAGLAIHRRVQVAASAPLSHASYEGGYSSRGMGDVYLSGKIGLIDPDRPGRRTGVAVIPVLEILSSGSNLEGEGRLHWALPVTVERRFDGFRAYAAGGYFSRGALFGSGAVEVPVSDKVIATAVLSHSRSLTTDPLSDALELSTSRFDLAGGAAWILTPTTIVFGSLGRTISKADANASSLAFTAGVSVGFTTLNRPRR
jgi:hypothetical protein